VEGGRVRVLKLNGSFEIILRSLIMVALPGRNANNPLALRWETGYLNIGREYLSLETISGNWVVRINNIGKIEQADIELGGTILKIILKESRRPIFIYGPNQIMNKVQAILSTLLKTTHEQTKTEADLRM
jgi:hypothetical protein